MPRLVIAPRVVPFAVGMLCVALLFVIYLVSAPPLLLHWVAGANGPTAAGGWHEWPQRLSALMIAVTSGLIFAAATRLGCSPAWAASASLACGLGWSLWMVAVVMPSGKSVAIVLAAVGVAATAWWSAGDRSDPMKEMAHNALLIVAIVCFVAGAWVQPLLPPDASVRMSASPRDVARLLVEELRPVACILAAAGAVQLWSRARRAALVLGAVLAAYLLLPLVGVVSPEAALLPASLPLWIAVACGLQWITRAGPRRVMLVLASFLAVLLPAERWLLNDVLVARAATPFFPGSLALSLAAVGPGGTLLSDGPATDRRIARTAAVLPVGPFRVVPTETWTRDEGATDIFAFHEMRAELEAAGRRFRTVPRRAPLSVFLRMLPEDNIVAIALTPVVASVLSREPPGYFMGIGSAGTTNAALAHALIGRVGAQSGAIAQEDREAARVTLTSGTPWGDPVRPSPIAIDAVADRNYAAIAVEGREIVRVPHGGALVVTSREGLLQMAYVITSEQKLLMPLPADEWSLAQLLPTSTSDGPLPDPFFGHPQDASALVRFDGRDASYFTSGWHLPERNGPIDFMWTSEAQSRLLIPLTQPIELRVMVELRPAVADDRDPPFVGLHVNGRAFDRQPAPPGRRTYEWRVPEAAWRPGANDVAIELTRLTRPLGSHDQRLLGAAVSLFRLERVSR